MTLDVSADQVDVRGFRYPWSIREPEVRVSAEFVSPQDWHPGVAFSHGGQIAASQDQQSSALVRAASPTERFQIGAIDVIGLDDRYFEAERCELVLQFMRNAKGEYRVRITPLSLFQELAEKAATKP